MAQHQRFYGPLETDVLKQWQVSSDSDVLSSKCLSAALCISWWNKSSQQLAIKQVAKSPNVVVVK